MTNPLFKYWDDEDYRGYVMVQMGLCYCGVHTKSKTAEILNVNLEDILDFMRVFKQINSKFLLSMDSIIND